MSTVLFVFLVIVHLSNAFVCPNSNGTYVNPNDYRSFYNCSNYCYQLQYCQSPSIYFTRTQQACVLEPPDWQTRYDLTGQFTSQEGTNVYVQQTGYSVYVTEETTSTHYQSLARYINETYAIGIETVHLLVNNCIVLFNIRIVATDNRAHCYYATLHPFSSTCDLQGNYSKNYCQTY